MSDGYKQKHESGAEKRKKRQKLEDNLKQMKNPLVNYVNLPDHENEENNIDPIFTTVITLKLLIFLIIGRNAISRIQSHEHSKEQLSAISVKLERQKCMLIDIELEK